MSNEINKGWKYFFGISAVIGSIATVFMCVLAYLAPKEVTNIIYQFSGTTPELEIVEITVTRDTFRLQQP